MVHTQHKLGLRNNAPVTFVRLVGQAAEDAVAGGLAGWQTTDISAN